MGGGENAVRVEEGVVSQEWAQPPEAGKGREVDSPWRLQKEGSPADTSISGLSFPGPGSC